MASTQAKRRRPLSIMAHMLVLRLARLGFGVVCVTAGFAAVWGSVVIVGSAAIWLGWRAVYPFLVGAAFIASFFGANYTATLIYESVVAAFLRRVPARCPVCDAAIFAPARQGNLVVYECAACGWTKQRPIDYGKIGGPARVYSTGRELTAAGWRVVVLTLLVAYGGAIVGACLYLSGLSRDLGHTIMFFYAPVAEDTVLAIGWGILAVLGIPFATTIGPRNRTTL